MNFAEAKKKVTAEKSKDNYMVLKFEVDYNKYLVVPAKDGVALLEALANAEILNDRYDEQKGIHPLERETFNARLMSRDEYLNYKMAQLLGVSPEEIKELSRKQEAPGES